MRATYTVWCGLSLYALLSAGDWLFTYTLLTRNPDAFESNPVAAAWLHQHGWSGLAVFKGLVVLVFVAAVGLVARRRPLVAIALVVAGCAVTSGVLVYTHGLIRDGHPVVRESEPAAADPGAVVPAVVFEPAEPPGGRGPSDAVTAHRAPVR